MAHVHAQVRLNAAEAALESVQTGVATQMTAMVTAATLAAAEQAATLSTTVSTMSGTMDTRINAVLASLGSTATVLRAQQSVGAVELTAAVNGQLRSVNTSLATVTSALTGKRAAAGNMWVGSCSNHGK